MKRRLALTDQQSQTFPRRDDDGLGHSFQLKRLEWQRLNQIPRPAEAISPHSSIEPLPWGKQGRAIFIAARQVWNKNCVRSIRTVAIIGY
jgi:hypothetical protein